MSSAARAPLCLPTPPPSTPYLEKGKRDAKVPAGERIRPADGVAVALEHLLLCGHARDAHEADHRWRETRIVVKGQAHVGQVRERVADRGHFPVEHANDAVLGGVEHDIVKLVVAVHDGDNVLGQVRRVPAQQIVDTGQRRHLVRDFLLPRGRAQARNLALIEAAGAAKVGQAHLPKVDRV